MVGVASHGGAYSEDDNCAAVAGRTRWGRVSYAWDKWLEDIMERDVSCSHFTTKIGEEPYVRCW